MAESKRPAPGDGPAESVRLPRSHRAPATNVEQFTPDEWKAHKNTPLAHHEAALTHAGWLPNTPLAETEYDDAILAAQEVEIR